jgi:hypothetical protein
MELKKKRVSFPLSFAGQQLHLKKKLSIDQNVVPQDLHIAGVNSTTNRRASRRTMSTTSLATPSETMQIQWAKQNETQRIRQMLFNEQQFLKFPQRSARTPTLSMSGPLGQPQAMYPLTFDAFPHHYIKPASGTKYREARRQSKDVQEILQFEMAQKMEMKRRERLNAFIMQKFDSVSKIRTMMFKAVIPPPRRTSSNTSRGFKPVMINPDSPKKAGKKMSYSKMLMSLDNFVLLKDGKPVDAGSPERRGVEFPMDNEEVQYITLSTEGNAVGSRPVTRQQHGHGSIHDFKRNGVDTQKSNAALRGWLNSGMDTGDEQVGGFERLKVHVSKTPG